MNACVDPLSSPNNSIVRTASPRRRLLGAIGACFGLTAAVRAEVSPLTPELVVNEADSAPSPYSTAVLARAGDGSALVAWTTVNADQTLEAVYVRRYDALGRPQSAPHKIAESTYIGGLAAAINADGAAVVAWSTSVRSQKPLSADCIVHAQRYDSSGATAGSEITIPRFKGVASVAVAMDNSGDFALAWGHSVGLFGLYGYTLYQNAVYLGVYGADGKPRVPQRLVNDPAHTLGGKPYVKTAVAMDEDGDFAVAWDAARGYVRAQAPDRGAVLMRRYSRFGVPGPEVEVDSFPRREGLDVVAVAPSLAMDAAGDVSVQWTAAGMPTARFYDAQGKTLAPRFYPPVAGAGYSIIAAAGIARAGSGPSLMSWSQVEDGQRSMAVYPARAEAQFYAGDGSPIGTPFAIGAAMLGAPIVALDAKAAPAVAWITPDQALHLRFYTAP